MSRIHAKSVIYTPEGPADTDFNRAIHQYDRYIGTLMADLNVWRMIALITIGVNIFSIYGWYKTINLPRSIPVIVEVSELGVPKNIGSIEDLSYTTFEPKDYMIKSHIGRFIKQTREINLDSDVMYKNINEASWWISDDMKYNLKLEINENDPFMAVGLLKQTVEIETIINTTEKTWQADWVEIRTTLSGAETGRTKYRGIFTIAQVEPRNEKEKEMNPLGLYIIDYNYSEIKAIQ